jgi:nucleoid-associated protein EbfC
VKGFGNMMKEAQKLQQQMAALQEEVGKRTVEATAGGGMVTVVMNGLKQVEKVTIDPEVVSKEDVEMLQDMIVAAIADAHRKTDEELKRHVGGMLGGMGIPGM